MPDTHSVLNMVLAVQSRFSSEGLTVVFVIESQLLEPILTIMASSVYLYLQGSLLWTHRKHNGFKTP